MTKQIHRAQLRYFIFGSPYWYTTTRSLVFKRNTFIPPNNCFRLVCLMAEILDNLPSATALKIATARQKKDKADEAFKSGNVKEGAYFKLAMWTSSRSVCLISFEIVPRGNRFRSITSRLFSLTIQALMYLLGLDKYVFTRRSLCFNVELTVLSRNALQSLGMSSPPPADVTDATKGKERTEVGS